MNPAYVAEFARYPHQPWHEITAELDAELAAVQAAAATAHGDTVTPADYAEALVPYAMRLVATVHDEGPDAVRDVLAEVRLEPGLDQVDPWQALAVVLAGMVDPEKKASELLGWTKSIPDGDTTPVTALPQASKVDKVAVERCCSGRLDASQLRPVERIEVVRILTGCGLSLSEITARTGMNRRTVSRWRTVARWDTEEPQARTA